MKSQILFLNSDNSLIESDSKKYGINVYITYGKNSKVRWTEWAEG